MNTFEFSFKFPSHLHSNINTEQLIKRGAIKIFHGTKPATSISSGGVKQLVSGLGNYVSSINHTNLTHHNDDINWDIIANNGRSSEIILNGEDDEEDENSQNNPLGMSVITPKMDPCTLSSTLLTTLFDLYLKHSYRVAAPKSPKVTSKSTSPSESPSYTVNNISRLKKQSLSVYADGGSFVTNWAEMYNVEGFAKFTSMLETLRRVILFFSLPIIDNSHFFVNRSI